MFHRIRSFVQQVHYSCIRVIVFIACTLSISCSLFSNHVHSIYIMLTLFTSCMFNVFISCSLCLYHDHYRLCHVRCFLYHAHYIYIMFTIFISCSLVYIMFTIFILYSLYLCYVYSNVHYLCIKFVPRNRNVIQLWLGEYRSLLILGSGILVPLYLVPLYLVLVIGTLVPGSLAPVTHVPGTIGPGTLVIVSLCVVPLYLVPLY